jgi:hypothetical protein
MDEYFLLFIIKDSADEAKLSFLVNSDKRFLIQFLMKYHNFYI